MTNSGHLAVCRLCTSMQVNPFCQLRPAPAANSFLGGTMHHASEQSLVSGLSTSSSCRLICEELRRSFGMHVMHEYASQPILPTGEPSSPVWRGIVADHFGFVTAARRFSH